MQINSVQIQEGLYVSTLVSSATTLALSTIPNYTAYFYRGATADGTWTLPSVSANSYQMLIIRSDTSTKTLTITSNSANIFLGGNQPGTAGGGPQVSGGIGRKELKKYRMIR